MADKEYWDVGQWQKPANGAKPYLQRLGQALPNESGGFDIFLNAMPIQQQIGSVRLSVVKKLPSQHAYKTAKASE